MRLGQLEPCEHDALRRIGGESLIRREIHIQRGVSRNWGCPGIGRVTSSSCLPLSCVEILAAVALLGIVILLMTLSCVIKSFLCNVSLIFSPIVPSTAPVKQFKRHSKETIDAEILVYFSIVSVGGEWSMHACTKALRVCTNMRTSIQVHAMHTRLHWLV
jgi:hypothetical protein